MSQIVRCLIFFTLSFVEGELFVGFHHDVSGEKNMERGVLLIKGCFVNKE